MRCARRQVLPHRQDVDAGLEQILQDGFDLFFRLAQPQHEAAFGGHERVCVLEFAQKPQRVPVVGPGARGFVERGNGFKVVIEDVGRGLGKGLERLEKPASEVGHENFDADALNRLSQGGDDGCVVTCAAVGQIVSVHARDDGVFKAHFLDGACKPFRFGCVQRSRAPVGDVAKGAAPRADLAHDENGSRAVRKALSDVGAGGFAADG